MSTLLSRGLLSLTSRLGLFVLIAALAGPNVCLATSSFELNEFTVKLGTSTERSIGDRLYRDIYRDTEYFDDAVVAEYLQSIWQPLLYSARKRSEITQELDSAFAWQLIQIRDRTVNAFALPGGYFGVHLGLIGIVSSRDELASVLAHELSHVTQRHIARLMSKQSEQTPWLVGAMILGALAASKNPGGANAVIVGGQAAAAQSQLNFSRDMEREADRTGFGVASDAGFSPQGFVSMFEKLQQSNRNNDSGNFPYLRSHPLTTERIADMKSRIPEGASTVTTGTLEHAMVSARARLLSNSSVDALRNWYSETEPSLLAKLTSSQKVASLYGATLAAIKLRDFSRALVYSNSLQALVATDAQGARQSRYLRAELFMAEGRPDLALSTLGFSAAPKTRADLLLWIPLKVATGQADGAADAAQLWLIDNPTDASMWQQLASARASQGRIVAAVRAEAEVNIAYFDYAAAVSRLKAAQLLYRSSPQNADHIEASIVDVRLRQVEQLLREQAVER